MAALLFGGGTRAGASIGDRVGTEGSAGWFAGSEDSGYVPEGSGGEVGKTESSFPGIHDGRLNGRSEFLAGEEVDEILK